MTEEKYRFVELLFILFIIMLGLYYMYLASNTQLLGEDEVTYLNMAKDFMNLNYPPGASFIVPAVSLFYVPFFYVFGFSLGVAKAVIALFGFLTIMMVYLFCRKLDKATFFGINIFGLASVSIILTINYFTHFMLISYTEIPIAFFSVFFLYLMLDYTNTRSAVLVGVIMGMAFIVKASSIIFPMILVIFSIAYYVLRKDKSFLKLSLISLLVLALFLIPIVTRNMILFNYPSIEGINVFFTPPVAKVQWGFESVVKAVSIQTNYFDVFGYLAFFIGIFGMVYSFETKNEKMLIVVAMFLLFLAIYFVRSALNIAVGDPRYFSIVFPNIAIIGGYFLSKAVSLKKYMPLLLVLVLVFALSVSTAVALSTEQSQRYPSNYVDAIKWIKQNSNEKALVFTAYSGSLSYYGDREAVWVIKEFPDVMTANNSTFIHNVLKSHNISYILVWRGILAENYIIPESNIWGVFTYNFLNLVGNDKENFNMTYSNQDNFVFRVL